MPEPYINLDHNATTPIDPRVVEAMLRAWRDHGANPASQHRLGRQARRTLEEAREGILELLGAKTGGMDADQLIFTSGGTEANNLAILGLQGAMPLMKTEPGQPQEHPPYLFLTPIEHPSVQASAGENRRGCRIGYLPVNAEGVIDETIGMPVSPFEIPGPCLVSVMLANNETGVIQAVEFLRKLPQEVEHASPSFSPWIHTDAVQAVGKIPVSFRKLRVDAMTVAPHKFHGPLGIGALVIRHGLKLQPQLFGGFQQAGLRPGTENPALAVGFHEALKIATSELASRAAQMQALRDQLERLLRHDLPETVIIGQRSPRLPNTSCVSFPGLDRQALVMALDLAGVACSTGSACASGSSESSPTLLAMGLPKDVIQGAIRLSLGAFTTAAEVTEAARRISKTVNHLKSSK